MLVCKKLLLITCLFHAIKYCAILLTLNLLRNKHFNIISEGGGYSRSSRRRACEAGGRDERQGQVPPDLEHPGAGHALVRGLDRGQTFLLLQPDHQDQRLGEAGRSRGP